MGKLCAQGPEPGKELRRYTREHVVRFGEDRFGEDRCAHGNKNAMRMERTVAINRSARQGASQTMLLPKRSMKLHSQIILRQQ